MARRYCLLFCASSLALSVASGSFAQSNTGAGTAANPPAPPQDQSALNQRGASKSDPGAQAAPTRQDMQAAGAKVAETIVVTGTGRKQRIQNTASPITAFTDERRNLIGVEVGQDIVNLTPSASLQGDYLSLRGVGRFEDAGQGLDPGVAVNLDGVYTSSPSYLSQPDFLTDRVEIVRGPQDVTGRPAAGGAVNEFSRRPTTDYHADIRVGGDSLPEGYLDAAFSGPITSNLRFRIADAYDVTNGPGESNLSAQGRNKRPGAGDSNIFEAQLEWTPTDALDIWARYQNFQQHYNGFYGVGAGVGLQSPYLGGAPTSANISSSNLFFGLAPNPQLGLSPGSNPGISHPYKTDVDTVGHSDIGDDHTFSTNITYDLDFATLKYIGGYSQYTSNVLLDADYSARSFYLSPIGTRVGASFQEESPQKKHWYSNELQFASSGADRLRWLVGAYDYGEDYRTGYAIQDPYAPYLSNPVLATAAPPFPHGLPNPGDAIYSQVTSLATNSYAAYGELDYDITSTVRATAAFRYNWDYRRGSNDFRYVYDVGGIFSGFGAPEVGLDVTNPANPVTGIRPSGPIGATNTQSYQTQTGKAGLEWHPGGGLLAYASVARGYLPGGFDLGAFTRVPTVSSETLMDYELGVKQTLGKTLVLDGSAFWYQYNNLQVPIYTRTPGPFVNGAQTFNLASNLVNAQRARTLGLEGEATYSPTSDLHLTVVYSYLDAQFEEFQNPLAGGQLVDISTGTSYASLRGKQIPYAPHNKVAFSPQYVLHLPGGDLSLSTTWNFSGEQFSGVFQNDNYKSRQYQNVAFRALYQPTKSNLTFVFYARNVLNSDQYIYRAPSYYAQQVAYTVNPPFSFGAEAQYRF